MFHRASARSFFIFATAMAAEASLLSILLQVRGFTFFYAWQKPASQGHALGQNVKAICEGRQA